MGFDRYFKLTSYGLIATAFASLAITGELRFAPTAIYAVMLPVSAYIDLRGSRRLRIREWMWRTMAILYIPFVLIDAQYISKSRIIALVNMTLFLSAAKLFQDKRDRDWVFLYLIAFFQMLLAAGLTFNATFVGSLLIFIFFFVSSLAAFEIKRSRREVATGVEEIINRPGREVSGGRKPPPETEKRLVKGPVRYLMGASATQLALVALLALPLFFLIPRRAGPGFSAGFGDAEHATGFSSSVQLGDVASIKSNSTVAMRIKLEPNPGRWLRWRGIALDYYDGRGWRFSREGHPQREWAANNTTRRSNDDPNKSEEPVEEYPVQSISSSSSLEPAGANAKRQLIREEVYLEPLRLGPLFAASNLIRIRGPFPKLRIQDTNAVFPGASVGRITYTAWSDIRVPAEDELRADVAESNSDETARYLQLPRGREDRLRLDPRIAHLARDVTHGLTNNYDKARAIETYLKTNYAYSLNLRPTSGDPLAEFLFETRSGHCEYFATAMAILLRSVNVPTRIVNGFQMGEYNEINGMYTVRERDAHSWVEVYFPRSQTWQEFDPTPPGGINDYSQGGLVASFRKYLEAAEVFWMDYVVTLDRDQQATLIVGLQHRLIDFKDLVVNYYLLVRDWALATVKHFFLDGQWSLAGSARMLAALLVFALILILISVLRAYAMLKRGGNPGHGSWWQRIFVLPLWRSSWVRKHRRMSAVLFYEQMLAILARRGLQRATDQTPTEFSVALPFSQVGEITRLYNQVRFGRAELTEKDTTRITELLKDLRLALKRR